MGNENEVVAVLSAVELSSPEFLIRDELCHNTHTGKKLFAINDSFTQLQIV